MALIATVLASVVCAAALAACGSAAAGDPGLMGFLPIILMFVILYFLIQA